MSRGIHAEAFAVARDERPVGPPDEQPAAAADREVEPETPQAAEEQEAVPKLSVLVGSDDPFTRQALRAGASVPDIEVLADGTVPAVAEQLASQFEPDVVLLDVQTAAAYALRAIQRIRINAAQTRVLACSAPAGTEFGMLCLSAGAWGFVSKEIDLSALPGMLRALARGEVVIPRALTTELVRRFAHTTAPHEPTLAELSAPECRLLDLLRTGCTLSEAASEIGVTLATARRQLGSARRKVSVPHPPR